MWTMVDTVVTVWYAGHMGMLKLVPDCSEAFPGEIEEFVDMGQVTRGNNDPRVCGITVFKYLDKLMDPAWWLGAPMRRAIITELRECSKVQDCHGVDQTIVMLVVKNLLERVRPWEYALPIARVLRDYGVERAQIRFDVSPMFSNLYYAQQFVLDAVLLNQYDMLVDVDELVTMMHLLDISNSSCFFLYYDEMVHENSIITLIIRDAQRILKSREVEDGFYDQSFEYTMRYMDDLRVQTHRNTPSGIMRFPITGPAYRGRRAEYGELKNIRAIAMETKIPMWSPWRGMIPDSDTMTGDDGAMRFMESLMDNRNYVIPLYDVSFIGVRTDTWEYSQCDSVIIMTRLARHGFTSLMRAHTKRELDMARRQSEWITGVLHHLSNRYEAANNNDADACLWVENTLPRLRTIIEKPNLPGLIAPYTDMPSNVFIEEFTSMTDEQAATTR